MPNESGNDVPGEVDISVVVPVYNEESNIRPFLARLVPTLEKIGSYEIIFSVDPCTDRTEDILREEIAKNPAIGMIRFSRRVGQPKATLAGVLNCRGASCAVIDVDLQDPPELIAKMHARLAEGFEVVTAKRRTREGETLIKKIISSVGYRLINAIADVQIPRDTGDFRVVTRRVIEELRLLPESHGFLRGLIALVGFRQGFVEFDRDSRLSGAGNYNRYLGSLKIGLNGVFGFSTFPLSFVMWFGVFLAFFCVVVVGVIFFTKFWLGQNYPLGIPTITVLVLFMGGIQMIAIGIIGEYLGRVYDEVRRRPQYIIDEAVNVDIIESHGAGIIDTARRGSPAVSRPTRGGA